MARAKQAKAARGLPKPVQIALGCLVFIVGILVILAVVGYLIGLSENEQQVSPAKDSNNNSQAQVKNVPPSWDTSGSRPLGVSMEGFKAIKNGMTYKQVVEILGKEGTEESRVAEGEFEIVMYTWQAGMFGANMIVTFEGGRVMAKAQFGLR